ncbi:Rrf2 family transcriptional regulator [Campylobacter gastrosuis]|uniref:Rrf2 family transcriptional regulator n=1 Tax=Campylobacter gastrosuis TaxID=2974576 RepID=A0ABT7HQ38_9BACT|nr:Rrf2 family transcriptional regulator [Campylobacter gastrosuis]MDL0088944.1 Rrf2 family transcriptional regulator [Campylobacter gastrosuis]
MQIGVKFSTAIHILLSVEFFKDEKNTSEFLAQTIGTNPVIVRNIIGELKRAGLVITKPGVGGLSLAKTPEEITLFDIFAAINENHDLMFKIHNAPIECPLGGKINALLTPHFIATQDALKSKLQSIKISDLLNELKNQ